MTRISFFRRDAVRPTEEQRLLTRQFYQNASAIYSSYNDWKDDDSIYFIPLYLEMTYSIGGKVLEIAPDPVWMGSLVRCTLEHPELFQYRCPECGKTVCAYRYAGSPLSGRVDLEGRCGCGWKGYESVTGWRARAIVLRAQISGDRRRYLKYQLKGPFERLLRSLTERQKGKEEG